MSDTPDSSPSNDPSSKPRRCTQCGGPLAGDETAGICSACLLQVGFESRSEPSAPLASMSDSPSTAANAEQAEAQPDPADELSLAEVQALFSDLEIVELIGRGGMGVVYKARQTRLNRVVALKLLRTKCSQDPSLAERFSREARALAKLSHPNIVGVYDFGQAGDRLFLIMEFVDGTDLRRMLTQKTLTPQAALALVPPICDALQFAHEEGIVHRDIKPENILIDKRGRVRIADFGLARLLVRGQNEWTLTGTRQVMGTPHYMAPEQMEHPQEVDHRADIFSLGVVIYEMLTGELPLGRFDLPSKKLDIDVRLDKIVLRTLEKEPSRRYQHVSDVQTDVERLSAPAHLPLKALNLDFTRPSIYIPACGFLTASALDLVVGLATGSATHLLAAFPLGYGGWKMITRGAPDGTWMVALFGLIPLHIGALFSIPCALWTLYVLRTGKAPSFIAAPTSSHDLHDPGEKLAAGMERLQAAGGRTVEVARGMAGNVFSVLGRFPGKFFRRIARGLVACLIWLIACSVLAGLFAVVSYDRFPSTITVRDYSANQVKLKGVDDLFLELESVGRDNDSRGFTRLPEKTLNYTLQLSLYRPTKQAINVNHLSGPNQVGLIRNSNRIVYSSKSFVIRLEGGKPWEYEVVEQAAYGRLNVEPHVLLTDDLEELNFDAMALGRNNSFSASPASFFSFASANVYEYRPPLNDAQPLIAWFSRTGLEPAKCVAYGTSLFETLTELKNGKSLEVNTAGEPRLKPIATLLDMELFLPQGDGRLYVDWAPNRLSLISSLVVVVSIALAGCVIIILWMRRASQTPHAE